MAQKVLISVVGPTAIGKTKFSIALAKHFKTQILSSDSRQFYKEMQIGTAVPSKKELAEVPHHFIQHKSIHDFYSVGDFEKDALKTLELLFEKNNFVIMVGGSGLYSDTVTAGLDQFPEVAAGTRESLNQRYRKEGIKVLQDQLQELDPVYYKNVDLRNPHRLIRALEVCLSSGSPYSSFLNKPKIQRHFECLSIGITADREIIYDRINLRVDQMMQQGLLNEVKSLVHDKDKNALQTVGYKELFLYLEGHYDLDFAVEEIKKNSRRFAKRQLTWFKKNPGTLWIDYSEEPNTVIDKIEDRLKKKFMDSKTGPVFFIMGVSGCGKSTIGTLLSEELSVPFFDGDDFHPDCNVSKMAAGEPLTDADRRDWLLTLNKLAAKNSEMGAVIVCSALKARYREILSDKIEDKVTWILLEGTFEEIQQRLNARKGHFMPASLLRSQFETLEIPEKAIAVSISPPPTTILRNIVSRINKNQ